MELFILIIALAIATVPGFIARTKGRSFLPWFFYGLFLTPIAIIHALIIKPNENASGMKKCSACASVIPAEATICPACRNSFERNDSNRNIGGQINNPINNIEKIAIFPEEKQISNLAYQLFLTKKYNIEKNVTLDKYIISDDVYENLVAALEFAHHDYINILTEATNKEAASNEKLKNEQAKIAQEKKDNLVRAEEIRLENIRQEALQAPIRAAKNKRLLIGGGIMSIIVIIGFAFFIKNGLEKAKMAKEVAQAKELADEETRKNDALANNIKIGIRMAVDKKIANMISTKKIFDYEIGTRNLIQLSNTISINEVSYGRQGEIHDRDYIISLNKNELKILGADEDFLSKVDGLGLGYCATNSAKLLANNKSNYGQFILNSATFSFKDKDQNKLTGLMLLSDKIVDEWKTVNGLDFHMRNGITISRPGVEGKTAATAFSHFNACGNKL